MDVETKVTHLGNDRSGFQTQIKTRLLCVCFVFSVEFWVCVVLTLKYFPFFKFIVCFSFLDLAPSWGTGNVLLCLILTALSSRHPE